MYDNIDFKPKNVLTPSETLYSNDMLYLVANSTLLRAHEAGDTWAWCSAIANLMPLDKMAEELRNKNLVPLDTKKILVQQLMLHSQFRLFQTFTASKLKVEPNTLLEEGKSYPTETTEVAYAYPQDLQAIEKCPVILTSRLQMEKNIYQTDRVYPPPEHGTVAHIFTRDETTHYNITDLKPDSQVLQQRIALRLEEREHQPQDHTIPLFDRDQELRIMIQQLASDYYEYHLTHEPRAPKRTLPAISNAFITGQAPILMANPFQAITEAMSNAASGATRWKGDQTGETSYRATYTKETKSGTTSVHVDATKEQNAEIARKRVWQQVKEMGDLDSDVYIAFIAQLVNSKRARDKDGCTWINAANILDYRGIKPKQERTASGKLYSAGHRYEDLEKIADCVWHMKNIRITVDQTIYEEPTPGSRRKKTKTYRYRRESPLLLFVDVITRQELWSYAEGGHPMTEVAWQVKESPWMEPFIQGTNRMEGTILKTCLEYDPYRQMWEKRLSKYLMVHLIMNKHSASITRNVNALLEELSLTEEIDTRNPQRTKDRFEKALGQLITDGHISAWRYKEKIELPPRKWLSTWVAQDIVFTKAIVVDGETTPKALPDGK